VGDTEEAVFQGAVEHGAGEGRLERRAGRERESFGGRVLVRASSIGKMESKQPQPMQRACSTNALMLTKKLSLTRVSSSVSSGNPGQGPLVWVSYFEENPKYGLCYLLNSGAAGMKFIGSSFLIANCGFSRVKYLSSCREGHSGEVYEIAKTPESLAKKVKIIAHYRKELWGRKEREEGAMTNEQRITRERLRFRETAESEMAVFIVRHIRSSKINLFWFNNRDYQAIFRDCTEVLVSGGRLATYVNKLA
jgi:hypothetical protein